MYLINGSLINQLPNRLQMPNGTTRTSLDELSDHELATLNIFRCQEIKPEITGDQYYGDPVIVIDGITATATYPVVQISEEEITARLAQAKEAKKSEIAQARYEAETAGIYGIKTDRESQALLTGAVLQAFIDPTYSLNWKTVDGTFVELGYAEIMAVGNVVRTHVQAQFNKESEIRDKIDACTTVEEVVAITYE